jgi:glyoxylase-like metal-dependent hydrolase (beta-lactamase superfamily II)
MNHSNSIQYRWELIRAGALWLDGGGMFGIIPRAIWSRAVKADELGRVELAHNCLLLTPADSQSPSSDSRPEYQGREKRILIEAGSGDKFDEKSRAIYGLNDSGISPALEKIGCKNSDIQHAILTHLHFDHVGGLTRLAAAGEPAHWTSPDGRRIVRTFPNATVYVARREWEDSLQNRSVMTRTYLPENLHPLRDVLKLNEIISPFDPGYLPQRDEEPVTAWKSRTIEILPGIWALNVPGHTWAQQAIGFQDDRGQTVVFTPDVIPTANHIGAAYNPAYDVEPYISTITRRWFLRAAAENNWLLILNHEPGNPRRRVVDDGKGWWRMEEEMEGMKRDE